MTSRPDLCDCPLCASAVPTPEGFITLLGGFPERPSPDVRVLGEVDCASYTRRTIEYVAGGKTRVPAYLLVPRDRARASSDGRLPGVLAIHQDGDRVVHDIGKDEPAGLRGDADQRYGVELAERGYVVLIPDRGGHGSRYRPPAELPREFKGFRIYMKDGRELTRHLYASFMAQRDMFAGRMPWRWGLFEMHRAVDCLAVLPEVDAERIGAIGHSAGGQYAALLMYSDPRVKVGVSSCGTFLFRGIWGPNGKLRPINGFAGSSVPWMGRWGDVDDMLAGIAPRPWLETRGDAEVPERVEDLTAKARARYAELGVPERFEYVSYDGGHVFREDMRVRSYAWIDRWLAG
jgi:dienelactone hydrolase